MFLERERESGECYPASQLFPLDTLPRGNNLRITFQRTLTKPRWVGLVNIYRLVYQHMLASVSMFRLICPIKCAHFQLGVLVRGTSMENAPGSWRVSFDPRPILLHEALFVRDAAVLHVEPNSEIPPRLRGDVPDHSSHFSPDWRTSAGMRWTSWWHEVVRHVALPRLDSLLSDSALTRRPPGEYSFSAPPTFPVGNPEEFSATELDHVQGLAAQWSSTLRAELLETRGASIFTLGDNERIGSIAREVAARLDAPLDAMKAVIMTLNVRGEWSHRPLGGVLLCSESAMENEVLFASLLADAFVSGLDRQEEIKLPHRPAPSPAFRSILDSSLLIADGQGITLRLEGVYLRPQGEGFEIELSRSEESTGPPPRPYGRQGQPSDPERFLNHFSGIEVDVRFETESHDGNNSPVRPVSIAILNRFWRRGSGPNTLWFWVRVESPPGDILKSPRGYVTITTTWPECDIDHCSVELELTESDPGEEFNRRSAW